VEELPILLVGWLVGQILGHSALLCSALLTVPISYFNVTSGGIRCCKGTPVIKKPNPSLFIKGGTTKEEKNKSLDTEQIYGYGSQRGSMPRVVAVLAGCRQ
jgi:hypothetical protein